MAQQLNSEVISINDEPSDVFFVQEVLSGKGYDTGPIDGIPRVETREAIKSYQRDWNLRVTGWITDDLLQRLRQEHPATKPRFQKAEGRDCHVWNSSPAPNDKLIWEGPCPEGRASGRGTLTWRFMRLGQWKQEVYEGRLSKKDWQKLGLSVWVGATGDRYEGRYLRGLRHGHGVYEWASGASYDGQWSRGLPYGTGAYISLQGNLINGLWVDGCLEGEQIRVAVGVPYSKCPWGSVYKELFQR